MRFKRKFYQQKKPSNLLKKNEEIRANEVLLIDENGNNVGVKPIKEALQMAASKELDLVEVVPTAKPVVCKILDYSKYLYEQKKKIRKNKAGKAKALKKMRFSPVIDDHDLEMKVNRTLKFLEEGHNVRVFVERKRRQTVEQAKAVMEKLLTKLENYSTIEPSPKYEGRRIFITFKADGKK